MPEKITCISPVDGSVYASRPVASRKEIAATFAAAHAAQEKWKRLPLSERAEYCSAAVDAMVAMKDEIVPELAWQMGRPVRYGPGELRGFEERARYMIGIAEQALADIDPGPKDGFVRYVRRDPVGVRDDSGSGDGVLVDQLLVPAVAPEQDAGDQTALEVVRGDPAGQGSLPRPADGEVSAVDDFAAAGKR